MDKIAIPFHTNIFNIQSYFSYPFNIIIICDVYIVPYSARSCSKALYNIIHNIIIPDSDPFPPSMYLNSKGAYNECCHYRRKVLLTHPARGSFYGWVNQLPNDCIAAHRASNPRLFSCGSYTLKLRYHSSTLSLFFFIIKDSSIAQLVMYCTTDFQVMVEIPVLPVSVRCLIYTSQFHIPCSHVLAGTSTKTKQSTHSLRLQDWCGVCVCFHIHLNIIIFLLRMRQKLAS